MSDLPIPPHGPLVGDPPPVNGYPSVAQQIATMLRLGRTAQRAKLTEVAQAQIDGIARLAREYIEAGL